MQCRSENKVGTVQKSSNASIDIQIHPWGTNCNYAAKRLVSVKLKQIYFWTVKTLQSIWTNCDQPLRSKLKLASGFVK